MPGVILAVIMVVFFTVRDAGFDWMRVWWLWLFVLLGPIYFYLLPEIVCLLVRTGTSTVGAT
jgi:hypothetical protein